MYKFYVADLEKETCREIWASNPEKAQEIFISYMMGIGHNRKDINKWFKDGDVCILAGAGSINTKEDTA